MTSHTPLSPAMAHPERVCWGCARLCAADTPHPRELFGDDWQAWEESRARTSDGPT